MKRLIIAGVAALLLMAILMPGDASAQFGRNDRDRDRVCFYQDIRYQGYEKCYFPGDELADLRRDRNNYSSIRVFGRARVIVYDNEGFEGASAEFRNDVPDLGLRSVFGSRTWNDRIKSFRIIGGNAGYSPQPPYGRNGRDREEDYRNVRDGVCFYENSNFRGRSECFDGGDISDLGSMTSLNDRISSIRIMGNVRVTVFRDISFRGESIVFDRDVPDLATVSLRGSLTWNDQISSVHIDNRNLPFGRARGRPF